jgi:hypothetical protein
LIERQKVNVMKNQMMKYGVVLAACLAATAAQAACDKYSELYLGDSTNSVEGVVSKIAVEQFDTYILKFDSATVNGASKSCASLRLTIPSVSGNRGLLQDHLIKSASLSMSLGHVLALSATSATTSSFVVEIRKK